MVVVRWGRKREEEGGKGRGEASGKFLLPEVAFLSLKIILTACKTFISDAAKI